MPVQPTALLYTSNEHFQQNIRTIANNQLSEFVVRDDCAYSGRQVHTEVTQILLECAMANILHPNINIQIPYISSFAATQFNDLKNLKINGLAPTIAISEKAKQIPSIREILSKEEIETLISLDKNYGSDVYLNSTLTYFEHRLPPDAWSFDITIADCMKKLQTQPHPYKNQPEHTAREQKDYNRTTTGS